MNAPELDARAVFRAALDFDTPAEQDRYVSQVCGDDLRLRQQVLALLEAHRDGGRSPAEPAPDVVATSESGALPEAAAPDPAGPRGDSAGSAARIPDASEPSETAPLPARTETPGVRIGPYKLLEEIGEGGMGTVWMAEQSQPVRRTVALKVVKPGMDSRQVLARFEAERQAVALMDHPNIAKVLDAGATDAGRPFFVMELVKGVPITKYCDAERLTPRERLALFVPVCRALQHAHQKGIIHRDIKPSNVLVASYDGQPVPKVIDFGLAKAIGQQLTERTIFTGLGGIVGTLEYMSPEQAELNALDIDTRSDIYGLGVLLYELLTGTTPLTRERRKAAAITEVLRVIREEEAPRPSTRLSESGEALASISAARKTDPERLSRLVRGELDWIVMKALEKDRRRRYDTANGLARDIECYLADEPVEACPPSVGYRLGKLMRKHRTALLTAAAILLVLVAGAAFSTWQAVRATWAWQLADQRLVQVNAQRKTVQKALDEVTIAQRETAELLKQSDKSRAQAVAVSEFLVEAFRNPDPMSLRPNITVAEMLDQAADRIGPLFKDDPEIRASLLEALGKTYTGLSPTEKAVSLLTEAHAIRLAESGPDDWQTIRTLGNLAFAVYLAGDVERAIELGEEAVRRGRVAWPAGDRDSPLPTLLIHLTICYTEAARDSAEILPLCDEALKLSRSLDDDDQLDTALAMWNLARVLADERGRHDEALALAESAAGIFEDELGADHPNTIRALLVAACARYNNARQWKQSIPVLEDLHERTKRRFGDDHHAAHEVVLAYLCYSHLFACEYETVVALAEPAVKHYEDSQGKDHFVAIRGHTVLARAHAHLGNFEKALSHGREAMARAKATFGTDHAKTAAVANELFLRGYAAVADQLDIEQASELARPALEQAEELFGTDHYVTFIATMTLAECYARTTKYDEAEPILRKAAERSDAVGPEDDYRITALAWLARNQLQLGKHAEAETRYQELLDLHRRRQSERHGWVVYHTMSLLGASLAGQEKYSLAERYLLDGYNGMKQHQDEVPLDARANVTDALNRLIAFYQSRAAPGDAEEAARWQDELIETTPVRGDGGPSTDLEFRENLVVVRVDLDRPAPGNGSHFRDLPLSVTIHENGFQLDTKNPETRIGVYLFENIGSARHYGAYSLDGAKKELSFSTPSFAGLISWPEIGYRDAIGKMVQSSGYDDASIRASLDEVECRWFRPGRRALFFMDSALLAATMRSPEIRDGVLAVVEVDWPSRDE